MRTPSRCCLVAAALEFFLQVHLGASIGLRGLYASFGQLLPHFAQDVGNYVLWLDRIPTRGLQLLLDVDFPTAIWEMPALAVDGVDVKYSPREPFVLGLEVADACRQLNRDVTITLTKNQSDMESNVSQRSYTIALRRAAGCREEGTAAQLSHLHIEDLELVPDFSPAVRAYTASVPKNVSVVRFRARAKHPTTAVAVLISREVVGTGSSGEALGVVQMEIPQHVGPFHLPEWQRPVVVSVGTGNTSTAYFVTLLREFDEFSMLRGIHTGQVCKLEPAFHPSILEYQCAMPVRELETAVSFAMDKRCIDCTLMVPSPSPRGEWAETEEQHPAAPWYGRRVYRQSLRYGEVITLPVEVVSADQLKIHTYKITLSRERFLGLSYCWLETLAATCFLFSLIISNTAKSLLPLLQMTQLFALSAEISGVPEVYTTSVHGSQIPLYLSITASGHFSPISVQDVCAQGMVAVKLLGENLSLASPELAVRSCVAARLGPRQAVAELERCPRDQDDLMASLRSSRTENTSSSPKRSWLAGVSAGQGGSARCGKAGYYEWLRMGMHHGFDTVEEAQEKHVEEETEGLPAELEALCNKPQVSMVVTMISMVPMLLKALDILGSTHGGFIRGGLVFLCWGAAFGLYWLLYMRGSQTRLPAVEPGPFWIVLLDCCFLLFTLLPLRLMATELESDEVDLLLHGATRPQAQLFGLVVLCAYPVAFMLYSFCVARWATRRRLVWNAEARQWMDSPCQEVNGQLKAFLPSAIPILPKLMHRHVRAAVPILDESGRQLDFHSPSHLCSRIRVTLDHERFFLDSAELAHLRPGVSLDHLVPKAGYHRSKCLAKYPHAFIGTDSFRLLTGLGTEVATEVGVLLGHVRTLMHFVPGKHITVCAPHLNNRRADSLWLLIRCGHCGRQYFHSAGLCSTILCVASIVLLPAWGLDASEVFLSLLVHKALLLAWMLTCVRRASLAMRNEEPVAGISREDTEQPLLGCPSERCDCEKEPPSAVGRQLLAEEGAVELLCCAVQTFMFLLQLGQALVTRSQRDDTNPADCKAWLWGLFMVATQTAGYLGNGLVVQKANCWQTLYCRLLQVLRIAPASPQNSHSHKSLDVLVNELGLFFEACTDCDGERRECKSRVEHFCVPPPAFQLEVAQRFCVALSAKQLMCRTQTARVVATIQCVPEEEVSRRDLPTLTLFEPPDWSPEQQSDLEAVNAALASWKQQANSWLQEAVGASEDVLPRVSAHLQRLLRRRLAGPFHEEAWRVKVSGIELPAADCSRVQKDLEGCVFCVRAVHDPEEGIDAHLPPGRSSHCAVLTGKACGGFKSDGQLSVRVPAPVAARTRVRLGLWARTPCGMGEELVAFTPRIDLRRLLESGGQTDVALTTLWLHKHLQAVGGDPKLPDVLESGESANIKTLKESHDYDGRTQQEVDASLGMLRLTVTELSEEERQEDLENMKAVEELLRLGPEVTAEDLDSRVDLWLGAARALHLHIGKCELKQLGIKLEAMQERLAEECTEEELASRRQKILDQLAEAELSLDNGEHTAPNDLTHCSVGGKVIRQMSGTRGLANELLAALQQHNKEWCERREECLHYLISTEKLRGQGDEGSTDRPPRPVPMEFAALRPVSSARSESRADLSEQPHSLRAIAKFFAMLRQHKRRVSATPEEHEHEMDLLTYCLAGFDASHFHLRFPGDGCDQSQEIVRLPWTGLRISQGPCPDHKNGEALDIPFRLTASSELSKSSDWRALRRRLRAPSVGERCEVLLARDDFDRWRRVLGAFQGCAPEHAHGRRSCFFTGELLPPGGTGEEAATGTLTKALTRTSTMTGTMTMSRTGTLARTGTLGAEAGPEAGARARTETGTGTETETETGAGAGTEAGAGAEAELRRAQTQTSSQPYTASSTDSLRTSEASGLLGPGVEAPSADAGVGAFLLVCNLLFFGLPPGLCCFAWQHSTCRGGAPMWLYSIPLVLTCAITAGEMLIVGRLKMSPPSRHGSARVLAAGCGEVTSSFAKVLLLLALGRLEMNDWMTDNLQPGMIRACEDDPTVEMYLRTWHNWPWLVRSIVERLQLSGMFAAMLALSLTVQGVSAFRAVSQMRGLRDAEVAYSRSLCSETLQQLASHYASMAVAAESFGANCLARVYTEAACIAAPPDVKRHTQQKVIFEGVFTRVVCEAAPALLLNVSAFALNFRSTGPLAKLQTMVAFLTSVASCLNKAMGVFGLVPRDLVGKNEHCGSFALALLSSRALWCGLAILACVLLGAVKILGVFYCSRHHFMSLLTVMQGVVDNISSGPKDLTFNGRALVKALSSGHAESGDSPKYTHFFNTLEWRCVEYDAPM